ncbi:hypothetical protein ABZ690_12140 [Streptomyces sp. NPDC006967]|uniref:hypothetical protein n=1 Tax=unclassified Streptomyces TaxID=2593676 RepID=UPI0033C01CB8
MDTTQMEALIATVAVLGLFVLMTLPALVGVARDRRIDRQIERAAAERTATERAATERAATARATAGRPAGPDAALRSRGAASHRAARAA